MAPHDDPVAVAPSPIAAAATSWGATDLVRQRRGFLALLGTVLAGGLLRVAGAQPAAGRPTRVVVLSDFNGSYGTTQYGAPVDRAVQRTIALAPDLVLSTGDMVAGQRVAPALARAELEAMWQSFHARVSEPLARAGLPFAVTPGNHDASSGARFALEREVYRAQWLPRRPVLDFVDAAGYPFDYAFRVRDAIFVSIDATHVGHLARHQKDWLRTLLQRASGAARHRVAFTHVPLWPFAIGRERDFLGDVELESILRQGRVGVFLSGHHHAFYPGFKDGLRLVSQGCLGAAPRPLIGGGAPLPRTLTLLALDPAGALRIEAYGGEQFDEPLDRERLPPRIETRFATIVRDDLALPTEAPAAAGPDARPRPATR